jgi:5-methylcytosine-specific restriction protein A
MPSRPAFICACGTRVPAGTRCACQAKADRERKARFDKNRPTARERGYTTRWDQTRKGFLAKHPSCAMCGAQATVVDHIVRHGGDWTLFWTRTNWQPLCVPCHSRAKQSQERRS